MPSSPLGAEPDAQARPGGGRPVNPAQVQLKPPMPQCLRAVLESLHPAGGPRSEAQEMVGIYVPPGCLGAGSRAVAVFEGRHAVPRGLTFCAIGLSQVAARESGRLQRFTWPKRAPVLSVPHYLKNDGTGIACVSVDQRRLYSVAAMKGPVRERISLARSSRSSKRGARGRLRPDV